MIESDLIDVEKKISTKRRTFLSYISVLSKWFCTTAKAAENALNYPYDNFFFYDTTLI